MPRPNMAASDSCGQCSVLRLPPRRRVPSRFTATGLDYSNFGSILAAAAQPAEVGIKPIKGDYDERADTLWFARAGVPAHTIAVAADYSDYHKVSDEWQKMDYANMANVDRAVALGLLALASDAAPPVWNESSSAAKKYAEAAKKLHR
jgi:Peptidase family M28